MNGRTCEPEEYPVCSPVFDQLTKIPEQPRTRAELDEVVGMTSGEWGVCRDAKYGTFHLFNGFRKSIVARGQPPSPSTELRLPAKDLVAGVPSPGIPAPSAQPLQPAPVETTQPAAGMPYLVNTGLANKPAEEQQVRFAPRIHEVSQLHQLTNYLKRLGPKNYALVTVSAPWCPACKGYKSRFKQLAQAYGDNHLFIWIGNGDESKWSSLGAKGFPTVFLMDYEGNKLPVPNRNDPFRGIPL